MPSVSRPHDIIPQHRPALGEGVQRTGGGAAQQAAFIQVFKVSMVTPAFQRSAGFKRPHAANTLGAKQRKENISITQDHSLQDEKKMCQTKIFDVSLIVLFLAAIKLYIIFKKYQGYNS